MQRSRGLRRKFGFLLLCALAAALQAHAQNQMPSASGPLFSWSADPATVIVSYSETPLMLAAPDRLPRVQVFGDGWVWVHYPAYMVRAGDYEAWLSPDEIRSLLQTLSGVFDFDAAAVESARKSIVEARQRQSGTMTYRSESTLEQIEIRLEEYRSGSRAAAERIDLKLAWNDIPSDARDFPEIADLARLNAARDGLRALLDRDDLSRIETAPARD